MRGLLVQILAGFIDPANNGFDIGDLVLVLGVPAAAVGAFVGVRKAWGAFKSWADHSLRGMIRAEIEEFTRPIQPGANGGKSLPDVNRKLDIIVDHLGIELPKNLRTDK